MPHGSRGILINNTMTWENHLFGNEEHQGLASKLSRRSGIIRKLSFIMPRDKLRIFAEGLFFSLLNYCIDVYRNVWELDTYDEEQIQSTAFRKEDNMKLQVIVNKVLRSLTGLDRDADLPIVVVLAQASLSCKLNGHLHANEAPFACK